MWTLALILFIAACLGSVAWVACNVFDELEARWFQDEDERHDEAGAARTGRTK